MSKTQIQIIDMTPLHLKAILPNVSKLIDDFIYSCSPLEIENLTILVDARTNSRYCECHVKANKLVELATIDVPLDPDEQPEYRANREIVEDALSYQAMKEDAMNRRSFSNIVVEFTRDFEQNHPIKIIGGQHRFIAIKEALEAGVDEYHGLKIYFGLDQDQRFDVQLISNTNIAVSSDLFDRMQETLAGPGLRSWCQSVGLLESGQDFADRRQRGRQITVREARTFIVNFYRGQSIKLSDFDKIDTTPIICKSGVQDIEWDKLRRERSSWSTDSTLQRAGQAYSRLRLSQHQYFSSLTVEGANIDFAEKASNYAVFSAWSYVAGLLTPNIARLNRHYSLSDKGKPDPLNAVALAKGRHKSDPENYRGLGYRTDAKERGRLVELFYIQAEKGSGIDKAMIDLAIKKYHAKRALLEVLEAEAQSEI